MKFEIGQKINHNVLGTGTVVELSSRVDHYFRTINYVHVQFDADKVGDVRKFNEKELPNRLVKEGE